jgi:hypothetical protein
MNLTDLGTNREIAPQLFIDLTDLRGIAKV